MKIFRITIYFVILSLMCIKLYGQNNTKSQKDKKSTSEAEAAATRAAIIGEEGCVRFVSPSSVSIPQSGGYKQIYVELNEASCNYIVSESASWISIQDRGNTVFKIYCTPNTGTSTRTHSVNVDGKSIYVSQAGISINTYNVTGGGAYCYGESGVNVGLNGSQSGASYTLKRNGGTVKTLSGTGGAIDFGKQISAGTYTVTASISGMNKNMSGSANVTVKSSPQGFSVSGGGTLTVCDPNTSINLSDSETGKIYTLYKGGSVQGTQIGNGNAISWSNITAAGTYTITAEYNGCTRNMSGSASVNIQPVLTSGSINGVKTICHNNSAGTLGNSSSATGGFGTYNYQWQVSSNNSSWNNVSGATGTNYSPGNLTSSKYYRRRVQDGCDTKYTPSVKITVRSALAAGNINGAKTISYNASAGTLGNSNSASGGTGNYSYQWQVSTNNSSWTSISGATGTTYSPGNLSNSRYYRRRASDNGGCGTVYTSSVKVSVTPTSGSIASNQTINYNASASTLTNTSSPAGGNGSYSYQWQSSTNNSSWSNISGATGSTYSPGTLTGSKYYRRRIYSDGNYAYSSSVKITVRPTSGSIASNQTINYNASASTLTSASSPAGGNGSYFYQWQSSTNNSSWNNISGATGSSYSPGSLTSSRYYRRMVTSDGNSAHSSSVKITVRPTSGSIASNQTINYNASASTLTSASSPAGGNGSYSYQWQSSTNNSSWSNISGATDSSYSPGSLTRSRYYRRMVTSDGNSVYSSSVKITVRLLLASINGNQTIDYSTQASELNSSNPQGGNGSYIYQWQSSTDNSNWGDLSGANEINYSPGIMLNSFYYRLKVSSDGLTDYTNSVKVTVRLVAGSISGTQTIEYNTQPSAITNTQLAMGGNGSYVYHWQQSSNNSNWSDVASATGTSYAPGTLTTSTWYRRKVTSDGVTAYTSSVKITVNPYFMKIKEVLGTASQNYIKTINPQTECKDLAAMGELAATKGSIAIKYFDGLGRPMQIINVVANPHEKDIVQAIEYDRFGRKTKEYLPYAFTDDNKGELVSDAVNPSKWDAHYPGETAFVFAEKVLETSPLNRVLEQGAPGQAWQVIKDQNGVSTGTGHTIKIQHFSNAADKVLRYDVNNTTGNLELNAATYYAANQLHKTITKDENWIDQSTDELDKLNTTEEFKNKQGQVVLKRSHVLQNGSSTITEQLNTYYIYDDFGLLRYVLPPKAFKDGNNSISTTELEQLCYQYKYDAQKRMTHKKLPGAQEVRMVYDERDRLVATQDGLLRKYGNWMFTKYDAFNRPIITGVYSNDISRADLQSLVDGFTGINLYEERGAGALGYTKRSFPNENIVEYYIANFYDTYPNFGVEYDFDEYGKIDTYTGPDGELYFTGTNGLLTGTLVKVFGTYDYLQTCIYYDDKYRVIQTVAQNYQGGINISSTKYDFTGKVMETRLEQQIEFKEQYDDITIHEYNSYDHAGRLIQTDHMIEDGVTNKRVTLSTMSYNELGEMIEKNLHDDALQSVDYTYNIRGWLTNINNADLSSQTGDTKQDLFGMALNYHDIHSHLNQESNRQYNGNISSVVWKHQGSEQKAYGFSYDALNRLKSANFGSSTNTWSDASFDVAGKNGENVIGYDLNGNITSLGRKGTGSGYKHNFSYYYKGNQLKSMNRSGGNANPGSTHYQYDENGNMKRDEYKAVNVYYNKLNLPKKVRFDDGRKVEYTYDANGMKHQMKRYNTSGTLLETIDYAGSIVYKDEAFDYLLTREGRVSKPSSFVYEYHLKDHLGNTRVAFEANQGEAVVKQQSDYYPFGLRFDGYLNNDNKYLYNGKELQDETEWYDYGARMYDPAIARWMVPDPLAETYMPLSPFVYVANNPMRFIDPDGMRIKWDKDITRKEKRAIKKSLKQHKGSKTYRKMMRTLRKSDNVYTIKSSGAKSNKLASFAPNVGEKIPTYTQEEEDGSVTTHGGGSDPTNELGGTITFYSQNLNSLGGEVDTGVEEFVHAWQYDTYITSKDQAYMSNIPQLDWEFEAKTIVGTIVGESKMNNRFRRGPFDETPFSLASEIKRLNVGRQGLSGMYEGYHSIWLGGVDAFGGYNGLTSKTPGAVLKSQPSLLKSILKK